MTTRSSHDACATLFGHVRTSFAAATVLAVAVRLVFFDTVLLGRQESAAMCGAGECRIELVRVARVEGPGLASRLRTSSIFVDEEAPGRFLTMTTGASQLVAFDSSGKGSVLGNASSKPTVLTLVPSNKPEPRAWAYDFVARSLIPVQGDGSFGPARPFPGPPSFVLPEGRFIVAQQIRSPELAGHPIHVVDAQGNVVKSFGSDVPEYRSDIELVTTRLATPGANATVWAVAPGRYVFEQWNPNTGVRLKQVPVRSSWFKESLRVSDRMVPPNDVIEAVWDRGRTLWALIRVADAKWTAPVTPTEKPIVPSEYNSRFDWILEAIDPGSGRILASERFDAALWGRSSASGLLSTLIDGGKSPGIDVWRFRLARK